MGSAQEPDGHVFLEPEEYRAWNALLQLNRTVLQQLDGRLRAEHGLSVTEFDVLITLYNAPERRLGMSALAETVMLSPSGTTHLVTRLERDGLVRRSADPADRRKFYAELTDAGDEALRRSRPTHNAVLRNTLFERLTPSDTHMLGAIWQRLQR